MNTEILYGKSNLNIELPENSVLIEPTPIPALENDKQAIRDALKNPINSDPLEDLVKSIRLFQSLLVISRALHLIIYLYHLL